MSVSIRDLHPGWVAFGWFVAACFTGVLLLAFTVVGLIEPGTRSETLGVLLALVLGFFWGGFLMATRVPLAPVLHGVGMAIFSLLVWVALNLLFNDATGVSEWDALTFSDSVVLLLLQVAGAVVGARVGARWVRSA